MRALTLTVGSASIAYKVYMPFVQGGAVFVPTDEEFELREEVRREVDFSESNQHFSIEGVVVWVSSTNDLARQGVGIKAGEGDGEALMKALEVAAGDLLKGEGKTFTL